ncbi:zinc ABC transporter substrate-binding protein [Sulfitobacter sp. HNIBRBA3233]|uniref:zinc ABC transporter substrate-binding protein n=1 Tax=Sulfitobacter marinivivus TaxID=3158558 RepID=UPI0032DE764E
MKRCLLPVALAVLPMSLWADPPRVVTDIAPVGAIVARVMAGAGTPDVLIPPGASPHDYAMKPSQARGLAQADLVVWVGPGLTGFMEGPLDALAGGARVLTLASDAPLTLLPFREGTAFEAHDHGHGHSGEPAHSEGHGAHGDHEAHKDHEAHEGHADHEDHGAHGGHMAQGHGGDHGDHMAQGHGEAHEEAHGHGDGHEAEHADNHDEGHGHDHGAEGAIDPHLWLDPQNAARIAGSVAEALGQLDQENADLYARNALSFGEEIAALNIEVRGILDPIEDRSFIVLHDAFHYFEASFGIEAAGAVMAGDGASPGPARLSHLRERLAENPVKCAFAEPQMNTALIETAVEGQGVRVAVLDPMGPVDVPLADRYPAMIRNIAQSMADCLSAP